MYTITLLELQLKSLISIQGITYFYYHLVITYISLYTFYFNLKIHYYINS